MDKIQALLPRADDPTSEFLKLLQDPFSSQVSSNDFTSGLYTAASHVLISLPL